MNRNYKVGQILKEIDRINDKIRYYRIDRIRLDVANIGHGGISKDLSSMDLDNMELLDKPIFTKDEICRFLDLDDFEIKS